MKTSAIRPLSSLALALALTVQAQPGPRFALNFDGSDDRVQIGANSFRWRQAPMVGISR